MTQNNPHYFVVALGTTGDLHPFMSIAHALQKLGRKVTFITHSYYQNTVRDNGLEFVGIGIDEDFLSILRNPDIWTPQKGLAAIMVNYSTVLEQVLNAIQSATTEATQVVIAHPFSIPAAIMARDCGYVQFVIATYLAPSNLRTCYDPLNIGGLRIPHWLPMYFRRALWRFIEKKWIDPVAVAQINDARTLQGLSKVNSFLTHITETPDLSVTLFPSWFAPPMPDWPRPMLQGNFQLFEAATQHGLTPELSAFLIKGDKPLVFTPGTGNLHAAKFFDCALSAINRLGRRAIFLTKERAQLPASLPESILWQSYVPLSVLLPQVDALVHHGGIGTTAEALRCGTPQLVTPFAWDQFDNGARIMSLGVGIAIPARSLQSKNMTKALQTLCNSESVRTRCKQLASRFTLPNDSALLCHEIERNLLTEFTITSNSEN